MNDQLVESRVEYIQAVAADASFQDQMGIVRAMARCLTAVDAANLLRTGAFASNRLRDALLRKVVDDLGAKCLKEHRSLIRGLTSSLIGADARTNQVLAFSLSRLAEVAPKAMRHQIHASLLQSRYIGVRRRGYKLVGRDPQPNVVAALAAWEQFQDPEGASLLARVLPAVDLASIRGELLPFLTEGWQLSRLYLRIAEHGHDALEELRSRDGISYCYVCAKLGRPVSVEIAHEVLDQYGGDERLGLLVWSFGQMGLWEALKWVKDQLPELQERRMAALLAIVPPLYMGGDEVAGDAAALF